MATAEEIKQEIIDWASERNSINVPDIYKAFEKFVEILSWRRAEIRLASGMAKLVERFGGDGLGGPTYVVFCVGYQYFRVNGEYSDLGFHWDAHDLYEVLPVNTDVIEYLRKNSTDSI
jgi:hypothetical protein